MLILNFLSILCFWLFVKSLNDSSFSNSQKQLCIWVYCVICRRIIFIFIILISYEEIFKSIMILDLSSFIFISVLIAHQNWILFSMCESTINVLSNKICSWWNKHENNERFNRWRLTSLSRADCLYTLRTLMILW